MSGDITISREEQLKGLENFIDTVDKEISSIVNSLGWTMESITTDKESFTCPYNASHQLTIESLDDHLTSCQWKTEGYEKTDIPLSQPTLPINSPFSIKFDEQLQNEVLKKSKEQNPTMQIESYELYLVRNNIDRYNFAKFLTMIIGMGDRLIPRTSDRLLTDFTSDERKALYDYVIANTAKPDIGQDIGDINNMKLQEQESKELSLKQLLVLERNLKRRRTRHRGVHTNKKSHVEILREVIKQQMEIYTDYISGQDSSEQITNDWNNKTDDIKYKTEHSRNEAKHLRKISHTTSRKYNNFNSRDNNDQFYSKRNNSTRDQSREKNHHRHKSERYSDEYDKTYRKRKHNEYRSSHSNNDSLRKKSKY